MLSLIRYCAALLNLVLALALGALVVLIAVCDNVRHPDELFGLLWNLLFTVVSAKASILLFRPRFLVEGLRWHKRVAVLWLLSTAVNTVLSWAFMVQRGGGCGGCGTGAFGWPDTVFFVVMALLWAVLGWTCQVLFNRQAHWQSVCGR